MITEDFIADILGHGPRAAGYGAQIKLPKPTELDDPLKKAYASLADSEEEPEESEEDENVIDFAQLGRQEAEKVKAEKAKTDPEYGKSHGSKRRSMRMIFPSAIESRNRFLTMLNEALKELG